MENQSEFKTISRFKLMDPVHQVSRTVQRRLGVTGLYGIFDFMRPIHPVEIRHAFNLSLRLQPGVQPTGVSRLSIWPWWLGADFTKEGPKQHSR